MDDDNYSINLDPTGSDSFTINIDPVPNLFEDNSISFGMFSDDDYSSTRNRQQQAKSLAEKKAIEAKEAEENIDYWHNLLYPDTSEQSEPTQVMCVQCGNIFSKWEINRTFIAAGLNPDDFKCSCCGYDLFLDMPSDESDHKEPEHIQCEDCHKVYNTKRLARACADHGAELKTFTCCKKARLLPIDKVPT